MPNGLLTIFADRWTAAAFLLSLILVLGWITLVLWFIARFFSGRKLAIGSFSTSPAGSADPKNGHENCPRVGDWFLAIDMHREHTRQTIELISSQAILAEQKKYARDLSTRIVNACEKRFRELLMSKSMTGITSSKEYNTFIRYIDDVRRYSFELYVEACEENNFAKKADKAFEDYIKMKVTNIVDDTLAYSFKILPEIFHEFEGYKESMHGITKELAQSIELSLRTARELAIAKKNSLDALDESFCAQQRKIITGEYHNELPI